MFSDRMPENIQENKNNNMIQVYYDIRVDKETWSIHSYLQNSTFVVQYGNMVSMVIFGLWFNMVQY